MHTMGTSVHLKDDSAAFITLTEVQHSRLLDKSLSK